MKNTIIWIRDFFLLVLDLIKFRITSRQKPDAYKRMLSAFYLFGGAVNPIASKFLGKRKLTLSDNGVLGRFSKQELLKAQDHLKDQGYVVFENVLSDEICAKFLETSLSINGYTRIMDGGVGKVESVKFDRQNPQSIRIDYTSQDLVDQNVVQELISDESILSFAQDYLGAAPIIDLIAMWWHTNYSSHADKEAAQWFHFDMERIKWIKFFFYLTDVTETTGPHVFVPTTHKTLGIPFSLRKKGYVRLSDDEVSKHYPQSMWKEFTGKRGTLIVEDTRGLHKGKHCIDGDRLLFQIEFTSSPFGAELDPIHISPSGKVPQMKISLEKFPGVYSMMQRKS